MMCGWLLRAKDNHADPKPAGRIETLLDAGFTRSLDVYAACLRWTLRHRLTMMAVIAVTLAAIALLYIAIPKGFFPQQDNGTIQGTAEAAQDISYAAMVERVHELAKVVMADPDVQTIYYWVGANPTVNSARLMINLKPLSQRKASATDVVNRLRKATTRVGRRLRSSPKPVRTCRSVRGSARRNINIPCRIPTLPSSSNGRRSCWRNSPRCRNCRT
jgi:multidrug efflux pump subunit AcrB